MGADRIDHCGLLPDLYHQDMDDESDELAIKEESDEDEDVKESIVLFQRIAAIPQAFLQSPTAILGLTESYWMALIPKLRFFGFFRWRLVSRNA